MPYRPISNDFKLRTVVRWQKNVREGGVVYPTLQATRGARHLLGPEVRDAVQAILEDDPTAYLDEIADWLHLEYEISVPLSTLSRSLQKWGHSRALVHRVAAERDPVACEQFLEDVRANFTAGQMVWIDESAKDERTIFRRYGRSLPKERAEVQQRWTRRERRSVD